MSSIGVNVGIAQVIYQTCLIFGKKRADLSKGRDVFVNNIVGLKGKCWHAERRIIEVFAIGQFRISKFGPAVLEYRKQMQRLVIALANFHALCTQRLQKYVEG